MTTLEKFMSFANTLTGEQRGSLEENLAALMDSYSDKYALSADEITQIDARLADTNPQIASVNEITAIFGKSFHA